MNDGTDADGVFTHAEAIDVLRDYGALHSVVRRLIEIDQYGKAYADPSVAPNATTEELYRRLCDLRVQTAAAFAELVRIHTDLEARRLVVLGEESPDKQKNVH